MDNSLIKIDGDSKALSTLIDAISRGIGTLYRPWGIKREAKAKAAEIQILAEAKVKEQQIFSEAKKQLEVLLKFWYIYVSKFEETFICKREIDALPPIIRFAVFILLTEPSRIPLFNLLAIELLMAE